MIEVVHSGLQTSLQDAGRQGRMHMGVSPSGAMDPVSMQLANWLVGNPSHHPVLEMTLAGPHLRFHCPLTIALVGAPFSASLNEAPIHLNRSYQVRAGDELVIAKTAKGCRAYLAFSALPDVPSVFSSLSTHLTAAYGGLHGRALQNGDQLPLKLRDQTEQTLRQLPARYQLNVSGHYLIRCVNGVESDLFCSLAQDGFYQQQWRVSPQSNRMGIRLQGDAVEPLPEEDMISSGLLPGSVQLPPSGHPIVSARDGQTIGGYPRIAHVIKADMPVLGQLKPGDSLRFTQISRSQARGIYQQQQFLLRQLMGFSEK